MRIGIGIRISSLEAHDLAAHDLRAALAVATAGDTADTAAVAVDTRDDSGDVRTVVGILPNPILTEVLRRSPIQLGRLIEEVPTVLVGFVGLRPHVGGQVGMRRLHRLVDHRHDDILAARAERPRIEQIDVGARHASDLGSAVIVVPLILQQRVVHRHLGTGLRTLGNVVREGNHRTDVQRLAVLGIESVFHHRNTCLLSQQLRSALRSHGLVETHDIPEVHSRTCVKRLPFGIVCECTLELHRTQFLQCCIHSGNARTGLQRSAFRLRLQYRIGHLRRQFQSDAAAGSQRGHAHDNGAPSRTFASGCERRLFRTGGQRQYGCYTQVFLHAS